MRNRFEVRPVAVGLDIGLPDRRQVLRGQIADEVELEPSVEIRTPAAKLVERREQEDV